MDIRYIIRYPINRYPNIRKTPKFKIHESETYSINQKITRKKLWDKKGHLNLLAFLKSYAKIS